MSSRQETVERLSQELRRREQTRRRTPADLLSTGIAALDELLPDGGLHGGSLVECLATHSAGGAGTLAVHISARLSGHAIEPADLPSPRNPRGLLSFDSERGEGSGVRGEAEARGQRSEAGNGVARPDQGVANVDHAHSSHSGVCVIIDRPRTLYPPALHRLGLDLGATIVVHPRNPRDELWALEQSLRCTGVSVVLGWPELLRADDFRRLQLAIEHGGGIGLLLRSARHRSQPSWADLRLLVEPFSRDSNIPFSRDSKRSAPHASPPLPRETLRERNHVSAGEGPGVRDQRAEARGQKPEDGNQVARPGQRDEHGRWSTDFSLPLEDIGHNSCSDSLKTGLQQFPTPLTGCATPHPPGRCLRIELLHSRGRFAGGAVILEIDDETGLVHYVSRVAPAAPARRATGA